MSAFAIYVVGFLLLAAGLLTGAHFLGVTMNWLLVIGLVLGGLAIISGVVTTKRKESPDA